MDIDGTNLSITLDGVTSITGSSPGIDLNTTTGSFEVVGDGIDTSLGGNASGGTISNKTDTDGTNNVIGVLLNNAENVTLRRMQLNGFTNFANRGTDFNGTSAGFDEGSVSFDNLFGIVNFTGNSISGGLEDNVRVVNATGTLDMTVTGSTIGLNSNTFGSDGILVETLSSAFANLTATNNTFLGARGDLIQTNVLDSSTMNDDIGGSV